MFHCFLITCWNCWLSQSISSCACFSNVTQEKIFHHVLLYDIGRHSNNQTSFHRLNRGFQPCWNFRTDWGLWKLDINKKISHRIIELISSQLNSIPKSLNPSIKQMLEVIWKTMLMMTHSSVKCATNAISRNHP